MESFFNTMLPVFLWLLTKQGQRVFARRLGDRYFGMPAIMLQNCTLLKASERLRIRAVKLLVAFPREEK